MKALNAVRFVFGVVFLAFGGAVTLIGVIVWTIVHFIRKAW